MRRLSLYPWDLTVEIALPQMSPDASMSLGARARYLPDSSGRFVLYEPEPFVDFVLIVRQLPWTFFWIFTCMCEAHAAVPSATWMSPRATKWFFSCNETDRLWVTVKGVVVVAVPLVVVTLMAPVDAPAGTTATICVAVLELIVAGVPLNLTDVAPPSVVPLMVTDAPIGPLDGANEVIPGRTVKFVRLVPVPAAVVTLTLPVVAAAGTTATICIAVLDVTVATVPLNLTDVALPRSVPVIVTEVPTRPEVGLNDVMPGVMVKFAALVPVPAAVVTLTFPVVAPAGTTATIWVAVLLLVVVADTPLNFTEVALDNVVPVMVTEVPTGPDVGKNDVTAGVTVKLVAEAGLVPPAVVTVILPVVAVAGTTATMDIAVFVGSGIGADTPLKLTSVALPRSVPVMVTDVPTGPEGGANEVIPGVGGRASAGAARPTKNKVVTIPIAPIRPAIERWSEVMATRLTFPQRPGVRRT